MFILEGEIHPGALAIIIAISLVAGVFVGVLTPINQKSKHFWWLGPLAAGLYTSLTSFGLLISTVF